MYTKGHNFLKCYRSYYIIRISAITDYFQIQGDASMPETGRWHCTGGWWCWRPPPWWRCCPLAGGRPRRWGWSWCSQGPGDTGQCCLHCLPTIILTALYSDQEWSWLWQWLLKANLAAILWMQTGDILHVQLSHILPLVQWTEVQLWWE